MQNSLPTNYLLINRYEILGVIGQGGFGITYKALDRNTNELVCIKELFISGNSSRDGSLSVVSHTVGNMDFSYFRRKFLEEAQTLSKMQHENIVKVRGNFAANDTAYMVMDLINGITLKDWINNKGVLDENKALKMFRQLLDATEAIHALNFLHRDIKPDNILVTETEKIILIDFGTAKFDEQSGHDGSTLVVVNHGYAPPEQYSAESTKGKYTDVYALGATLYFMLTGKKPIQSTDRTFNELSPIKSLNSLVSDQTINSVTKAMSVKPSDRFQNVVDFKDFLFSKKGIIPSPPPTPPYRWILIGGIGVIALFILLFLFKTINDGPPDPPVPVPPEEQTDSTSWHTFYNNRDQLLLDGFEEGEPLAGYESISIDDPNGEEHHFRRIISSQGSQTSQTQNSDPCAQFKQEEKKILNSGFIKGPGGIEDESKSLNDCNGNMHLYHKKKRLVVKSIKASFKKSAQNTVQWSEDLKNGADKITIVFNNGYKTYSRDVTGMNSYKFDSGDKDFDGVECTVELIVVLKPEYKLSDTPRLTMKTHC
jgi:serine/threonine protein kinase